MFISSNKLVWAKISSTGTDFYPNVLSGLTFGSDDYVEAKGDFINALRVSFSDSKVFAISADSIMIYDAGTLVAGQTPFLNKLASTVLPRLLKEAIATGTSSPLFISASCKCSQIKVTTLLCFAENLKCITASAPVFTDCTVAYPAA